MGFSEMAAHYKRAKKRVIKAQFEKYGYNFCEYCKIIVQQYDGPNMLRDSITADHILAKSKKGKNLDKNLLVCCFQCNQEKGSMEYKEFIKNWGEQ
jgi:5-methylcytosine-specific restriction endonuclease McrA